MYRNKKERRSIYSVVSEDEGYSPSLDSNSHMVFTQSACYIDIDEKSSSAVQNQEYTCTIQSIQSKLLENRVCTALTMSLQSSIALDNSIHYLPWQTT